MHSILRYAAHERSRMRAAGILLLAAALLCAMPLRVRASTSVHSHGHEDVPLAGQWLLDSSDQPGFVSLTFNAGGHGWSMNWSSSDVPVKSLAGLDLSDRTSGSHPVEFVLKRDAGSIRCQGVIEKERGAGVFHLDLDPSFAAALEKRGVGRPSADQQARLAYADAGFALLDELKQQHFATPNLEEFVTMAEHGVNLEYVRGMAGLGYHLESIAELIRARDHGVDPDYIVAMRDAGYRSLSFDQLITARDHGVDAKYVATIRDLGGRNLSLEKLIELRDHGVDAHYVASMRDAGYRNASLEEFQAARDHGVDACYATAMANEGFKGLSLEDLIRARDHGVDAAYVRRIRDRVVDKPSLDEVIHMRDTGF